MNPLPDGDRQRADAPADVVETAAAPFGPSAYARARLLRQLHAAGRFPRLGGQPDAVRRAGR